MAKSKDPSEKITTIKLLEETKNRIEKLREHKRESYDDILRKILYVLNVARESPEKAKRVLERIEDLRKRMIAEEAEQKAELEKADQRE
jgi:CRISPR/Cas system-associated protein Cas5 (RAMP superfamily)